jgi:hypothetical protein
MIKLVRSLIAHAFEPDFIKLPEAALPRGRVPVVNLNQVRCTPPTSYPTIGIHWNERGQEVVADPRGTPHSVDHGPRRYSDV